MPFDKDFNNIFCIPFCNPLTSAVSVHHYFVKANPVDSQDK